MKDAETVAAFVWSNTAAGTPPAEADRKVSLAKVFQGFKNAPALVEFYAKMNDQDSVKTNLENSFSAKELAKMISNIKP